METRTSRRENKEPIKFKATSKIDKLHIDSKNKLFKVINGQSNAFIKSDKTFGGAALSVATFGISTMIKSVSKDIKKISSNKEIYSFNDLVEFELLEDDTQITSGGLGRALVGGIVFGGVGAIVGGATGKRQTKKAVNHLIVRITINDIDNPLIMIPLITKKTKTNSNEYKNAFNTAQRIISALNVMANE